MENIFVSIERYLVFKSALRAHDYLSPHFLCTASLVQLLVAVGRLVIVGRTTSGLGVETGRTVLS